MNKKIIIINIILLIVMIFSSTNTYATTLGEIIDEGDNFLKQGDSVNSTIDTGKLNETSNIIYNILLTIAIVLAIIIGLVIGIQFMMGSVEEQAKVKETLVPYIIGVFVVFSAFTIWKIAVNIGNDVTGDTTGGGGNYKSSTYTVIKMGVSAKRKCNACGWEFYKELDQCPNSNCGVTFQYGLTTRTKVKDSIYKCDFCEETYDNATWKKKYCPNCEYHFDK